MPELNREQIALLETLIQSEVDGTGAGEHIDRIRRPDGRCYLADREEQERGREREERCRRSHDYRVAIFSALLSFAVGFALGCITGGAL